MIFKNENTLNKIRIVKKHTMDINHYQSQNKHLKIAWFLFNQKWVEFKTLLVQSITYKSSVSGELIQMVNFDKRPGERKRFSTINISKEIRPY